MIAQSFSITDEAQVVVAADDKNRTIYLNVVGNNTVYLGGADVTSTNGLPKEKHDTATAIEVPYGEALYAVCAENVTEDLRVLSPDLD